jgi:hypothetical protein
VNANDFAMECKEIQAHPHPWGLQRRDRALTPCSLPLLEGGRWIWKGVVLIETLVAPREQNRCRSNQMGALDSLRGVGAVSERLPTHCSVRRALVVLPPTELGSINRGVEPKGLL